MINKAEELLDRYQKLALTKDHTKTAQDVHLRELEIKFALPYVKSAQNLLDVGCGIGFTTRKYSECSCDSVIGLDYSENMISVAREISSEGQFYANKKNDFVVGSVLNTSFESSRFDLITSHRCLMALLDWDLQMEAIKELHRVLKPGGKLILFEGTTQGIDKLNTMRKAFDLEVIDPYGSDSLFTLKFDEEILENFLNKFFRLEVKQGFGTYYFLSRVFYPLHVAPNSPTFLSDYNEIAKLIADKYPDLVDIGHLKAYVLTKI